MTFKNLKELNTTESRSCALVFNFNNKELIKIKKNLLNYLLEDFSFKLFLLYASTF